MYWLVYQQLIESQSFDALSGAYKIKAQIYIRKVKAESEAEAIGKFMIDTENAPCIKRVEPVNCFEYDKLRII